MQSLLQSFSHPHKHKNPRIPLLKWYPGISFILASYRQITGKLNYFIPIIWKDIGLRGEPAREDGSSAGAVMCEHSDWAKTVQFILTFSEALKKSFVSAPLSLYHRRRKKPNIHSFAIPSGSCDLFAFFELTDRLTEAECLIFLSGRIFCIFPVILLSYSKAVPDFAHNPGTALPYILYKFPYKFNLRFYYG